MAQQVPRRRLGKNGPMVPPVGFGTMNLSIKFMDKPQSDEERFEVLDAAHALGSTHFDTADVYADSEDLLGKWFKRTGKRDDIFLATKFAGIRGENGYHSFRNDPEYVKEACAKSLKRLGVEYIDLYYCHRFSGDVPVETIVHAMKELVNEGKVKHLGLSECSAATLRRAHAAHPIAAVQLEYSPFSMDIEDPQIGLLEACRELGVAVVSYAPLGRGFLTGTYRSPEDLGADDPRRVMFPRFQPENFAKNLVLVDQIKAVAERKGCTPGQLTLAWLLTQGDVFPIPGTISLKHLEENADAAKVGVSPEEEMEIRKAIRECVVHGTRYPEAHMKSLFGDTPPLTS